MLDGFDVSQLSDEQIKALLELGGADEQKSELDDQMQQAIALGQPSSQRFSTPTGAALGALGGLINQGSSKLKQQKLRDQKQELLKKQLEARGIFTDAMFGRGRQQSRDDVLMDNPNDWDNPFGYGG